MSLGTDFFSSSYRDASAACVSVEPVLLSVEAQAVRVVPVINIIEIALNRFITDTMLLLLELSSATIPYSVSKMFKMDYLV